MSKLFRNSKRGMIFGVCAGIADYFGFDVTVTRVVVIVAALFSFPILLVAYLLLAFLLPTKASSPLTDETVEPLQRRVRADPHDTLGSVRHRFRELDSRLQQLEKYVTSNRFKLDREFRHLKD